MDAPNSKIVTCDLTLNNGFQTLVPETKDVISSCAVIDTNRLVLVYLADVKHVGLILDLHTGELQSKLDLPEGSIISSMSGKRAHSDLFYSFSSFTTPGKILRLNAPTDETSVYRETLVNGIDLNSLKTEQVFYPSKDGTMIPMFIVSHKDTVLNGDNPTLLYGYGGFNISITPSFSISWMTFIKHLGGVVAVANIRGGGEYGQKWCDQGKLANKQNVFDDFKYAAKHLIEKKYTSPKRLCINGGSNGGLLVGACLVQEPELFGCCIAEVGVLDMFRFHKFTIGHAWTSDYGNPDVKEDFEVLAKYSPIHNSKPNNYPAVLIMTGDHDDRVVPLHSLKFLATMQHNQQGSSPVMGRIETKAGHGAGKSTQQRIQETSDKFGFVSVVFDLVWRE